MAPKRQITNKGLELLASSSKATGQHWWLGWYALAFVPDELQEDEKEKLGPNMTKLTENGDIIYNIFQGDMNGDGYQTTRASSKFKSVNYDSNIKKNYRYVLDENGRNNLVTWVDGKNGLKGACVYPGVGVVSSRVDDSIGFEASKIPLPAPLLYTGVKAAGDGWSTDGMNIFLGSGNDRIENFYPVEDVEDVSVDGKKVPRVSADFRNYEGYRNGLTKLNDGEQGYDDALNTDVFNDVDVDGWFPSVNTYTQNGESEVDKDYNKFCRQYWKVLSISNFNKYCAPVNASGLLYDENTGCRNMSKATKYFPISDYSVTSTSKTADNEYATGIKLKVDLKLNGNAEDGAYFKDVEMDDSDNVATLDPNALESEHALFNTQKVSFKFNRIGIYAVPMRQYGCSDDSGDMKAQYQIDTEAEPVLFAVYEWDSPVTLSDSGEGLSEFQSEVFIDFSTAVEDSSVIRESAVFYNLYEDDALDWYKNQLVANAAMGEAIINMQIEMGYLRNQKNAKQGCCPKSEEIKSDDKVSTGLRNLVDAKDYNSNSVRNRLALDEGKAIDDVYSDNMPHFGGIGYPQQQNSGRSILARKTTDEQSDSYSAFYGTFTYADGIGSLGDAVIDGHVYFDMTPSSNIEGEGYAARFGKLWLRTKLYYEIYSFINQTGKSYDYPEDVESNDYVDAIGTVTDMCGEGRDTRGQDIPYITITRTPTEISTTEDGITRVGWYPSELNDRDDFVAEIDLAQNPFSNYEIGVEERTYHVYYDVNSDATRDYSQYKFLRTKKLKLPKVQMYNFTKRYNDDADFAIPAIRQQLSSTGWRIPTMEDWTAIIANTTDESIDKVRSSSYWTDAEDNPITGGTGDVCPLGGVTRGRGGTSVYNATKAIYLAIDEGDDYTGVPHVVVFDGKKFTIIERPNFPEFESSLNYVGVLCVADAVKISDGIPKYKLGYDSYALMEGSVSAGDHNLNAGKNSIMMASAHYNAILSGMDNKITDSHYNTVLNGISNELTGAVFSAVAGSNNIIGAKGTVPTCRALIMAERTLVYGSVASAIFAEASSIESACQSSIIGCYLNVSSISYGTLVGRLITLAGHTTEHPHFNNLHIYGSLALAAGINNQLILGGLDGTTIGPNENSASSYIAEFGSFITGNSKNYPIIWSLGGVGMYMNKMVLGNRGVDGARAPSVNDVLTVVGTEDNVATVAWKPGGSGNGAKLIIIHDDGVIVPYRGNNQYVTISSAKVSAATQPCVRYSVLQDGEFTVYNNRSEVVAYDHPDMGSPIPLGLRPNGSNKIIWNTWHKIVAEGVFDNDPEGTAPHVATFENPEKRLYIVTDNLFEGVVYEVTINIRANARVSNVESIMDVDGTHAGGMLAPGMDDRSFYICFYNNNGGSVTANRWADSTHSSNYYIRPTFNRVPTEDKQVAWGPSAGECIQAPVLATATAYFVKIDGKIYVMGY